MKAKTVKPKEMPGLRRKSARERNKFGKFSRDDIDWDLAESFFVMGETYVEKSKGGDLGVRLVTQADVARRFKCSASLVSYMAKRRKWKQKREEFRQMQARTIRQEVAKARAMSLSEGHAILDQWLTKFADALERDTVRVDSIADFGKALHLKAFLQAQGSDGVDKSKQAISLEELQAKHQTRRKQAQELQGPSSAGVLNEGTPDTVH